MAEFDLTMPTARNRESFDHSQGKLQITLVSPQDGVPVQKRQQCRSAPLQMVAKLGN